MFAPAYAVSTSRPPPHHVPLPVERYRSRRAVCVAWYQEHRWGVGEAALRGAG